MAASHAGGVRDWGASHVGGMRDKWEQPLRGTLSLGGGGGGLKEEG